jgi:hypothetical protein
MLPQGGSARGPASRSATASSIWCVAAPVLDLEPRILRCDRRLQRAQGALNPLLALGRPRFASSALGAERQPRVDRPAAARGARDRRCAARPDARRADCCCRNASANYTDFYASIHHASNVGSMFRPDNALAAELQVGPHRVPRACFVGGSDGNAGAPAVRSDA